MIPDFDHLSVPVWSPRLRLDKFSHNYGRELVKGD